MQVSPDVKTFDQQQALRILRDLASANKLPTLEPLLPLLLNLRGKPFSLHDHFHFAPLFRLRRAQRTCLVCARQVGKSTFIGADTVVLSTMRKHFATLCVTPLYEQIRRFSTLVIRPFVMESPVRDLMVGTHTENSVLQRTFRNGSRMMFSFASVDANRIRGLSVNRVAIDETQDIEKELLPVIMETMSADTQYMLELYAGTPKTTDGTLNWVWEQSSQAEWWIPCQHCTTHGYPTWNIPSTEYHLYQMIGPLRPDISPELPAIVCFKCGKPLYSRLGHWEHRYPERRWDMAGYHVPQPIVPLHYADPRKWATLLKKQRTTSEAVFANECLAEARDEGQKLITQAELRAACTLPWDNRPNNPSPLLMRRLSEYKTRVLAIDWGGGGESGLSFTVMSLLGLAPDNTIECGWAKLFMGVDHIAEAKEAAYWFRYFDCNMLAHDYSGAGTLRETLLIQAGVPMSRDMPIQYVRSGSQNLLVKVPGSDHHTREIWRADKTRSLHTTIAMIRLGRLKFFEFDDKNEDSPGLVEHFRRLIEHRSALEIGSSFYSIRSNMLGPDDFAQSVNYGCLCTWEINDAYPNLARAAELDVTEEMLAQVGGIEYGWENDPTMLEFLDY